MEDMSIHSLRDILSYLSSSEFLLREFMTSHILCKVLYVNVNSALTIKIILVISEGNHHIFLRAK